MRVAAAVVLAAAIVAAAASAAVPAGPGVPAYFLQGEQLARIVRPGSSPADAVRRLVAGPTRAETRRGLRTYVPSNTPVRRVPVADGLATVDLGRRFVAGKDPASLLARLSQLVRTVTGLHGTTRVQLLIDGRPVSDVFPGVPTEEPITLRFLQTPDKKVPERPGFKLKPPDRHVRAVQRRLIALGYLLAGDDDGRLGPVTGNAILAFQKYEGLDRTGGLDRRTEARLAAAQRPEPIS